MCDLCNAVEPTIEEKRNLVENFTFTYDGKPCSVGGIQMPWATVSPHAGGFYHAGWATIKAAADNGGNILKNRAVRTTSGRWLRIRD